MPTINYLTTCNFIRGMGILSFLKSALGEEKEEEEESIALGQLEEWFGKRASAKYEFLRGQILGVNTKIAEEAAKIGDSAEKLKTAVLRNPNIPERAKHFMEGNRETYIRNALLFAGSLKLPEDSKALDEFFITYTELLGGFSKATARPFHILKEFFDDEVSAIAESVRKIDLFVGEMKKHREDAGIAEIEKASTIISSFFSRMKRKEELQKEIGQKKGHIELARQDIEKMEAGIKGMRESPEFLECHGLKRQLGELRERMRLKEQEIVQPFSSLDRALRKFERAVVADRDVLSVYIESPVAGVTQDVNLRIVGILGKLSKAARDNTIELKDDRQKEKIIREVEGLTPDFLGRFQVEYGKMKKEEKDIQEKLLSHDVISRISREEESLRIKRSLMKALEHGAEKAEEDLKEIGLDIMKKAMTEKIKSALKVKVCVS